MLLTILAFIVVLGITITVHEFGHFAMAKLLKIRVLVFSLGFGPRLIGFTRGGTEYRLSPIPIGGYVKMAGEAYEEHKGSTDEFLSHPKWHRFLVAVAGPMMNILLAVLILTVSYMQGVSAPRYPKEPAVVGPVAAGSPAADAGLQTGDRVLSVSGNRIETWEDLEVALGTAAKDALDVEVARDGRVLPLHLEPPPTKRRSMPRRWGSSSPSSGPSSTRSTPNPPPTGPGSGTGTRSCRYGKTAGRARITAGS